MQAFYRFADEMVEVVWGLFAAGLLGAPGGDPYPTLVRALGWQRWAVEEAFEEIGVQPWGIIEELCEGDPLDFFRGVDSERKESSRGGRR
jgi:hypothetical protein